MATPLALDELPRPTFTDPRSTSIELHAHLRRLIIDSALPPGTILKQAEIAREFGVSRTPMREAFRMLQEEGLIEADLNQRARVRALDPEELDHLYAARITLEALGARMTAGRMSGDEEAEAHKCLELMEVARSSGDITGWVDSHRTFHSLCVARAGEPLMRVIKSYSERSERYIRIYQLWHPQSFHVAHHEHDDILHAVRSGDAALSGALMAHHLAQTAITVLKDVSGGSAGLAINEALAMSANGKAPRKGARK